jgi:hypothetical protein
LFDSQREQTAPPSGKRDESEAAVGDRKPVAVGWAEKNRVKVERERSDRTLRRFFGANRWGWRTQEAAGVHLGSLESEARRARGWGWEIDREAEKKAAVGYVGKADAGDMGTFKTTGNRN